MTNMDLAALMDSEVMRNYLDSTSVKRGSDMDHAALMDSEIMCNYLESELTKMAQPNAEINEDRVVEEFVDFEEKVRQDDKMAFAFKVLQKKFKSDPEYARSCDPLFVQAVVILDLDE